MQVIWFKDMHGVLRHTDCDGIYIAGIVWDALALSFEMVSARP